MARQAPCGKSTEPNRPPKKTNDTLTFQRTVSLWIRFGIAGQHENCRPGLGNSNSVWEIKEIPTSAGEGQQTSNTVRVHHLGGLLRVHDDSCLQHRCLPAP